MRDFQARRNIKKILFSWPVLVILAILCLILIKANFQMYSKERYTAKNRSLAQKEYNDAIERERTLSADIAKLSSKEGVDLELRRKFQVVKPGEEAVVIVTSPSTTTESKLEEKPSFWQNVLDWFGL